MRQGPLDQMLEGADTVHKNGSGPASTLSIGVLARREKAINYNWLGGALRVKKSEIDKGSQGDIPFR